VLVLSRKLDESIIIGSNITLRVLAIDRNRVRLGIDAPKQVAIRRAEILPVGSLWVNCKAGVPIIPETCLLYTSPSPRDRQKSRMPSSA
jgi:carbon storage regulator